MCDQTNPDPKPNAKERYKILIEARNFHYDNFSKWASYFYIAIGALFVAYYSIVGSDIGSTKMNMYQKDMLTYAVLVLGYILSMLWYWSTKGYYYWNINFIMLVNYYEKEIFKFEKHERIYSIFANKREQNFYSSPVHGANLSTSKIAILFAYIITVTWGLLLYFQLFRDAALCCSALIILILSFLLSIFTILILSVTVSKRMLYSKIDHMEELNYIQ